MRAILTAAAYYELNHPFETFVYAEERILTAPVKPGDIGGAGFATRQRIIKAAEVLFAERGVEGVSLRELTGLAKVNLAAIHYHFGTKEALLEHVFELRSLPIAQRRFMMLDECKRDRKGCVPLRDLLEAFLRPAMEIGDDPHLLSFMRLRARINIEKHATANAMLKRAFDETSKRYVAELCKTLPHLTRKDVFWRFHFILGAMTYTMANPGQSSHSPTSYAIRVISRRRYADLSRLR